MIMVVNEVLNEGSTNSVASDEKDMSYKYRKKKSQYKHVKKPERKAYKKMYFDLLDELLKQNKPKRRKKRTRGIGLA